MKKSIAQKPCIIHPVTSVTPKSSILPEASLVPVLGEVHGPLPLDGEAAAPEQLVSASVIGEVVEQPQGPVDNGTWSKVKIRP